MPPAILVLGASGMLGSTVLRRLRARRADWRVEAAGRGRHNRFTLEAEAGRPGLAEVFRLGKYDYVINSIGVLKGGIDEQRPDSVERAIRVNALFPHELADVAGDHGVRVVHVSTDAVFSGRVQQSYSESTRPDPIDVYGATKLLGESPAPNVLNVRCSIVGRDARKRGFLEWYLGADTPSVDGFLDYVWTPVTTVQFADWCEALIAGGFDDARDGGHVLHFAPNAPISKADFLEAVRRSLGRGPSIERVSNPGGPCHRVLASRQRSALASWPDLIPEVMKEFSSRVDPS
jgi:dTDP-4-dehydrorhamnose reductase